MTDRALVGTDVGKIFEVDTIEFAGEVWLVPQWLLSADRKWQRPARIINMSRLAHQDAPFGNARYVLSGPLPMALLEQLDGPAPKVPGFEVIEAPDIPLPGPAAKN